MATMVKRKDQHDAKARTASGPHPKVGTVSEDAMQILEAPLQDDSDAAAWDVEAVQEGMAACETCQVSDATAADLITMANARRR